MSSLQKFGKYIMFEKIASGGMAEVYLAKSIFAAEGISKFFSIKRILPQYSDNKEFIDMFIQEAKLAINLNHNNVVSLYEFGMEESQLFIVMEFVEGQNLRQVLNKLSNLSYRLSIDQIVYIIKEVASGLDHAHRCIDSNTGKPLNIIHRDLSPQNIMVSFEGEVKVIDFGIAKAANQIECTRSGTLKGKFGYMSPEQVEGQAIDLRTDIFSLGIVLWELLANLRLFASRNEAETLRKIRECQIPNLRKINPNIPFELKKICDKALAKERNFRYQTAAELSKDLNRFLNMQYPDFSAQEFSVYIKSLYSDTIIENRNKLVKYARTDVSKFVDEHEDPKTKLLDEKTLDKKIIFNKQNETNENDAKRIKRTPIEFDFEKIGTSTKQNILKEQKSFLEKESRITRSNNMTKSNNVLRDALSSPSYSIGGSNTRLHYKTKKYNKNSLDWVLGVVLIVLIILLYWVKQNKELSIESLTQSFSSKNNREQISDINSKSDNIKKTLYFDLLVYSEPSGANILVDGDEKAVTPSKVVIKGNKPFKLTVKKEGYLPYDKLIKITKAGSTIKIKLVKTVIGYLNINILNGGSSTQVYINGKRILDKPPIKKYAVPAGIPILISAKNHFSGAQESKQITVEEDSVMDINLILK